LLDLFCLLLAHSRILALLLFWERALRATFSMKHFYYFADLLYDTSGAAFCGAAMLAL
jgi:hypothetical protein